MCVCVFHFSCGVSDKSLCICARTHTHTLQYAGCHSYQNANLTASLLQTTFTQKKRVALPSIHPFIHSSTCPPIVEKWNTLKRSYTTQSMPVCVCVYLTYVCTLHVCTLPWLQAGLTGVITSKPPSQQAKRERNGLKVNTHTHTKLLLLVWSHIPLSTPHSFNRVQWHIRREGEMVERRGGQRRLDFIMHTDSTGAIWMYFWGCLLSLAWIIPASSGCRERQGKKEWGRNIDSLLCHLTSLSSPHERTAGSLQGCYSDPSLEKAELLTLSQCLSMLPVGFVTLLSIIDFKLMDVSTVSSLIGS